MTRPLPASKVSDVPHSGKSEALNAANFCLFVFCSRCVACTPLRGGHFGFPTNRVAVLPALRGLFCGFPLFQLVVVIEDATNCSAFAVLKARVVKLLSHAFRSLTWRLLVDKKTQWILKLSASGGCRHRRLPVCVVATMGRHLRLAGKCDSSTKTAVATPGLLMEGGLCRDNQTKWAQGNNVSLVLLPLVA